MIVCLFFVLLFLEPIESNRLKNPMMRVAPNECRWKERESNGVNLVQIRTNDFARLVM